ncbi:polyamine deacetylase HDAC10 isoform X3 [Lutra lutra]|uniref:polyamine deacetylase HDAC10 isoform X3 n=1 Tax=Lutra lutra TaxID=9657 RepID=UPI001FD00933|nr:polyamine deacetylase HDAC10 isoform X3 [Lutra lutra]
MRTALVYHEEMTAARLLWDDPECEIERPERLTAAVERLQQGGLEQRCLQLAAREASEAELGLVHRSDPPGATHHRGHRLGRASTQPAPVLKTELPTCLSFTTGWMGEGTVSPEYVSLLRGTQALSTEELQALSGQYDAVYFHPSTFHCARLAAGAALQLVDAVLTGTAHNGFALVRPPGHHSQRAAANGFCVFNNVAIAARYAQKQHGVCRCVGAAVGWGLRRTESGGVGCSETPCGALLCRGGLLAPRWEAQPLSGLCTPYPRILIVDWDVHHGQGIQYIFEDDPSVLYFSWHRYEHGRFWPYLRESDADAVGLGPGRGFTVNLPWNQVGMGNADYMAAFLHVLLPVAFEFDPELVLISAGFDSAIGDPEGQMQATPECFAHLTQLLQVLAGGRVCAVLEVTGSKGGSLAGCQGAVRGGLLYLAGRPAWAGGTLPRSQPCLVVSLFSPCSQGGYHLESLSQCVCMVVKALLGDPAPPLLGPMVPQHSALESIQSVWAAQAPHWTSLWQQERRPSAVSPGGPKGKAAEAQTSAVLSSLLDQLHLYTTPPVRTVIALTAPAAALVLPPEVLHQEGSAPPEETQAWARLHEALTQDTAFTALGKVLHLLNGILDGQVSSGIVTTPVAAPTLEVVLRQGLSHGAQRVFCVALGQLDRPPDLANDGRTLWLNIRGKEAAALSTFHVSVPLSGTTGGFLSCILALVLPLAYGFQPDLVLVALGPAHGLQDPQAALLAALLRGPAGGRVLVLVEQESTCQLVGVLARVLHGEPPPSLGPFSMASPDDLQALVHLRGQLEAQWEMLQLLLECHELVA